jgi:hypothetical protein
MDNEKLLGAMCLVTLVFGGGLVLLGALVLQLVGRVADLSTQVATLQVQRDPARGGCAGILALLVFLTGALLFAGVLAVR